MIAKARTRYSDRVGKAPEVPIPPQLEPGGAAGKREAEQRPQGHVAVLVDERLGNLGNRRIGQRPHRGGAGDIGRDAQYGADDEHDEAGPLHDVVVHGERDEVENEREHEPDRREVIQDHMDVRPRLRGRPRSHVRAFLRRQMQLEVIDLPAELVDDDHQDHGDQSESQDHIQCLAGELLVALRPPQLIPCGGTGDHEAARVPAIPRNSGSSACPWKCLSRTVPSSNRNR